jgi:hypothetical protein
VEEIAPVIRPRTIAAAWIVAAVAAAAAWTLWRAGPVTIGVTSRARVLGGLQPHEVRVVRVRVGEGPAVAWRREGTGWRQSEPFECRVDDQAIDTLVAAALGLEADAAERADPVDALLAAARLDAPLATVELGDGTSMRSLSLGRRLPGGRAWVRADPSSGGNPQVADGALHGMLLELDPRQWRDARLFTRADIECDAVSAELRGRDGVPRKIELARQGAGWRLVAPIATRAERAAVERWIEALARARALGVVSDSAPNLAAFGLEAPFGAVEIRSVRRVPDGDSVREETVVERVEIGAPVRPGAEERYARIAGRPDVLELDAASAATFMPLPMALVEATATGVRPADVREVVVERDGQVAWTAARDASAWRARRGADGDPQAVDAREVDQLLTLLCEGRASDISLHPAPAELSVATVMLLGFDGRTLAAVRISREANDGRWGMDDGSGVLRVWPSSAIVPIDAPLPRGGIRLP